MQSPAEDHEQERVPPAAGCSLATCLAPGNTACRNWEHLSDSHILEAAPANRAAGEAQQRQRWIPVHVCVCVFVCLGWKGPLKVLRFCVDYGNLLK